MSFVERNVVQNKVASLASPWIGEVAVIGCGTMGRGIAQVCAQHGVHVRLIHRTPDKALAARASVLEALKREHKKGRVADEFFSLAEDNLVVGEGWRDLSEASIVLETITEDYDAKRSLIREVRETVGEHAVFASNTSSISITKLASNFPSPERFVGLHFMNPAPAIPLVEIVRGARTSDETVDVICEFTKRIGRDPVSVGDFPGFVVNRVLIPMINEAAFALHEGVAPKEAIDAALKGGAKHPLGPLELADLIGLDVCLAIMNVIFHEFSDTKYRPCPLLKKYVEAGWLGRKTGRGFYEYPKKSA